MRALSTSTSAKRVATWGVLVSVAMVLSYVESVVSLGITLPGVKLGLCHLVTLYALYRMKVSDVWLTAVLRVALMGMLFGNMVSLAYSGAGCVCSIAVMCLLSRCKGFSMVGVSVAGGVAHNIGQLACAALLMQTKGLLWYLPVLLVAGCVCGVVVGLLGAWIVHRLPQTTSCTKEDTSI